MTFGASTIKNLAGTKIVCCTTFVRSQICPSPPKQLSHKNYYKEKEYSYAGRPILCHIFGKGRGVGIGATFATHSRIVVVGSLLGLLAVLEADCSCLLTRDHGERQSGAATAVADRRETRQASSQMEQEDEVLEARGEERLLRSQY